MLNKYGFPIVMLFGLAWLIWYIWNWVTKEINRMAAENTKAIAANNKEVDARMKALDKKINDDLKKALDNPLANR